jgi:hypothetical protein
MRYLGIVWGPGYPRESESQTPVVRCFIDAIFGHSLGPGVSTRVGVPNTGESRNVTQYSKRENVLRVIDNSNHVTHCHTLLDAQRVLTLLSSTDPVLKDWANSTCFHFEPFNTDERTEIEVKTQADKYAVVLQV